MAVLRGKFIAVGSHIKKDLVMPLRIELLKICWFNEPGMLRA